MTVTWGSMKTRKDQDAELSRLLNENAPSEQDCLEQAKRELDFTANSGIDFVHQVLKRAQEIKRERNGK